MAPFMALFLMTIVVLWLVMVHIDKVRIRRHFHTSSQIILSIRWSPVHHQWTSDALRFGDGNRIYFVQYLDSSGQRQQAWCKTGLLNGVALEPDEQIVATKEADSISALHQ
jgi:hypothetical protein